MPEANDSDDEDDVIDAGEGSGNKEVEVEQEEEEFFGFRWSMWAAFTAADWTSRGEHVAGRGNKWENWGKLSIAEVPLMDMAATSWARAAISGVAKVPNQIRDFFLGSRISDTHLPHALIRTPTYETSVLPPLLFLLIFFGFGFALLTTSFTSSSSPLHLLSRFFELICGSGWRRTKDGDEGDEEEEELQLDSVLSEQFGCSVDIIIMYENAPFFVLLCFCNSDELLCFCNYFNKVALFFSTKNSD